MAKKIKITITIDNPSKAAEQEIVSLLRANEVEMLVEVYSAQIESTTYIYKK